MSSDRQWKKGVDKAKQEFQDSEHISQNLSKVGLAAVSWLKIIAYDAGAEVLSRMPLRARLGSAHPRQRQLFCMNGEPRHNVAQILRAESAPQRLDSTGN